MEKVSQDQAANTAVVADPNAKVVTLENPILRGTQQITEITIRKPNVGSLRALSLQSVLQWDVNSMIKLLPRITAPTISEQELTNMDIPDFTALNVAVTDFLASASAKSQIALMTS